MLLNYLNNIRPKKPTSLSNLKPFRIKLCCIILKLLGIKILPIIIKVELAAQISSNYDWINIAVRKQLRIDAQCI